VRVYLSSFNLFSREEGAGLAVYRMRGEANGETATMRKTVKGEESKGRRRRKGGRRRRKSAGVYAIWRLIYTGKRMGWARLRYRRWVGAVSALRLWVGDKARHPQRWMR
jgi:hypothetical protein